VVNAPCCHSERSIEAHLPADAIWGTVTLVARWLIQPAWRQGAPTGGSSGESSGIAGTWPEGESTGDDEIED
jgi:hypothetical protein